MNCVLLLLVGVLVPSNKRFAFARFGLRCFPNELEWILLLLFTLSSFPLTSSDRARLQLQLGYFYFCRFLLLWGGSNSNWTSASGLARDRQVRARATDGERKSGRTRNNLRIKDSGFASMTLLSPLLSSPRLSACLHSLSASSPARELSCLLDMINGPGLRRIARFGFTLKSLEESCVPFCLLVGRWRVSWSSPQGWGGTFFPQICTWLSAFLCTSHKGHRLKSFHWNYVSFNFLSRFNTSFLRFCTRTFEGNSFFFFFAGFMGDRQLGGQVCLFEANLCVSWQGCVV